MTTYKVGYLIGSLATQSINRKLAKALIRLAPQSLQFSEISFRDLPLYSYDYDDDYPEVARTFSVLMGCLLPSAMTISAVVPWLKSKVAVRAPSSSLTWLPRAL